MEERRKIKRRHLLYFGRVYDETARKLLGYLVDITESGFMLLSEEPILPERHGASSWKSPKMSAKVPMLTSQRRVCGANLILIPVTST